MLEDAGHGFGEITIGADVTVAGDECRIAIYSPPQIPYFINSYEGNSISGVYLGLMMFAQIDPPYNEGLYRCVERRLGPEGHAVQRGGTGAARELHHHPDGDAGRRGAAGAREGAPERPSASWGHSNGMNIAGLDTRNNEEYVTMMLASLISGAGATAYMDGWHAVGPQCCFGALISGDIETAGIFLSDHDPPLQPDADSGGAGKYRGGSGTVWEVEPLGARNDGHQLRRRPSLSGARCGWRRKRLTELKVGSIELNDGDQVLEVHRRKTRS